MKPEEIEGFSVARKISQGIRCYDIRRIIFGPTELISYDLSTVLWPHHHYPGAGVLVEIMCRSWRIL